MVISNVDETMQNDFREKKRAVKHNTDADGAYQSMMLVERAAEKPSMLKLISVAVQRARPAITGNRDKFTQRPVD